MEEPRIQIIEEPKQLEHRFRYKCEGNRAGSILGESSTNSLKTSPTIKIHNMGPKAVIVVSCVTKNEPHFPHPHSLVGLRCEKGVCTFRLSGDNVFKLSSVGIQCCRHQDVKQALEVRRTLRVDPFQTGHDVTISQIDLNAVRLCFQVFLPDANNGFTRVVKPVVTREIIDKRSFNKMEICRLSRPSAFARGGDELMILCDKVKKGDVQVRFFEDGTEWEAFGSPLDVHKQFAVTCKTPRYREQSLSEPVSVWVQLLRPSDDMAGEPKPFQFIPNGPDEKGIIAAKKRKIEQRGININDSTGSVPIFHLPESLLSYDEHLADPGAGLRLMDVVGLSNPSQGFSSFPPPYSNHANSYTSDEDDLRIVADLVDLVNNVPSGQQQVNSGNCTQSREVNVEVTSHLGPFISFAQTGQQQINLRSYPPGEADLGTVDHQGAFIRIPQANQGQVNLGVYTSNEEVNVDINSHALINDALTSQQGFDQSKAWVVNSSSRTNYITNNNISRLLKSDKPFPTGNIVNVTDDPVENPFL